jgi:hypothetical protein
MTWVRLASTVEAIVEVDLPLEAGPDALRDAALRRLDESGGAEWDTTDVEFEASEHPILSDSERTAAWLATHAARNGPTTDVRAATAARRRPTPGGHDAPRT